MMCISSAKCFILTSLISVFFPANIDAQKTVTINVNTIKINMEGKGAGFSGNFNIDKPQMTPALKEVNLKTYRFPMGTIANNYVWHDPKNFPVPATGLRPMRADGTAYGSVYTFDQFMTMINETGAEPVIMLNTLGHTPYNWTQNPAYSYEDLKRAAVEWVRYANITKGYKIKYWEIGNEHNLHESQMSMQEYIALFKDWSTAMKAVDPTIHVGLGLIGDETWHKGCIENLQNEMDFIVSHPYVNSIPDYTTYKSTTFSLISGLQSTLSWLDKYANVQNAQRIEVLCTEYLVRIGSSNGTTYPNQFWHGLITFEQTANIFMVDDRVKLAHKWGSTWTGGTNSVSSFNHEKSWEILNNGRAIQVFNQFLCEKMLDVKKSNGFIQLYSGYSPSDKRLTVWLVNRNTATESIQVNLQNYTGSVNNEKWVFKGSAADASTHYWGKAGSVNAQQNGFSVALDPLSITVVAFESNTTGIEHQATGSKFSLYPNPAQSKVVIGGVDGKYTVSVFNALGNLIQQMDNFIDTSDFDISHIDPGLYLVRISDGDTSEVVPLIKERK